MSLTNPSVCLLCLAALQLPVAEASEQRITRAGEQASIAGPEVLHRPGTHRPGLARR